MTVTSTGTTDGRARKSLAEQIDRLDGILDGLAEGLNGAVAAAVQQAVGLAVTEAVKAVLTELLHNPDLQQRVAAAAASAPVPPAAPVPGGLGGLWNWACRRARAAYEATASFLGRVAAAAVR